LGWPGGNAFDRAHGLVHLHQSGSRLAVPQELQQAFLILGTCLADGAGAAGVVHRQFRLAAGGAHLGVRVEHLAGGGRLAAALRHHVLVDRGELHLDVRGAAHETVEIGLDDADRAQDGLGRLVVAQFGLVGQVREQMLGFRREQGKAAQIDDLQCAIDLV